MADLVAPHSTHARRPASTLRTGKAILSFDREAGTITKELYLDREPWSDLFAQERRINRLFVRRRPSFAFARLLRSDAAGRRLVFEAIAGRQLSARRYVDHSAPSEAATMAVTLARAIGRYPVPRRGYEPQPLPDRVDMYARRGLTTREDAMAFRRRASAFEPTLAFAHGDYLPLNLLWTGSRVVAVDWEFARLYWEGYDLALLWTVCIGAGSVRRVIAEAVARWPLHRRTQFALCAFALSTRELGLSAAHGRRWPPRLRAQVEALRHVLSREPDLDLIASPTRSRSDI